MLTNLPILLADNQPLTQAGFARLLGGALCHTVRDRRALAVRLAAEPAAGVVLDYALFDFEGVESLLIFVRRFPEAVWLLASDTFGDDFLRLMASEPNVGFLPKDSGADDVSAALSALVEGRTYMAPAVRSQLSAARTEVRPDGLTATERDIVRLIAMGKNAREIADLRHSSIHTIITHKKNIFRKLGVTTVYEVTRYALRAGLADPLEYYI